MKVGRKTTNERIGLLFGSNYNIDGSMKSNFIKSVNYYTSIFSKAKTNNNPILIPLELELDIDGIGGIYPGNSFHSTYVPRKYKNTTVFQAFDVNHRVSSEGWTVTLIGALLETSPGFDAQLKEQIENYGVKALIMADGKIKESAEVSEKIGEIAVESNKIGPGGLPMSSFEPSNKNLFQIVGGMYNKWFSGE